MGNLIDSYINNLNQTTAVDTKVAPNMRGDSSTSIPATKPDSLDFLDMYTDLKQAEGLCNEAQGVLEGKINNKNAVIKMVPTVLPDGRRMFYEEGFIGDNQFQIKTELIKDPDNQKWHYTGQFGNKNIDLVVDVPEDPNKLKRLWNQTICNKLYVPDNITIKGKLGGKPYEFAMPNTKVPRDSDEKDLLTLMMNAHCFELGVAQGNIVSIEPGKYRIKGWERKKEKRNKIYKENIQPLISQAISTAGGAFIGYVFAKFGIKH